MRPATGWDGRKVAVDSAGSIIQPSDVEVAGADPGDVLTVNSAGTAAEWAPPAATGGTSSRLLPFFFGG